MNAILPYVLAADFAGHWYCHNHLPPMINSHYITRLTNMFLASFFCFKWRSKLSCCCNILDDATIRTSYNNRISYCWKHMHVWRSHCWGRRLFSIITSFPTMGATHMHMRLTIGNAIYCYTTIWLSSVTFVIWCQFLGKQTVHVTTNAYYHCSTSAQVTFGWPSLAS